MQASPIAPTIISAPKPDLTQIDCPQKLHCSTTCPSTHSMIQGDTPDDDIWQELELIHSWVGI
jgi:hypothetical protein